jgi:hypothetical protein
MHLRVLEAGMDVYTHITIFMPVLYSAFDIQHHVGV